MYLSRASQLSVPHPRNRKMLFERHDTHWQFLRLLAYHIPLPLELSQSGIPSFTIKNIQGRAIGVDDTSSFRSTSPASFPNSRPPRWPGVGVSYGHGTAIRGVAAWWDYREKGYYQPHGRERRTGLARALSLMGVDHE